MIDIIAPFVGRKGREQSERGMHGVDGRHVPFRKRGIVVNTKPMHDVIVGHDWREVNRVNFGETHEEATERCADCCAERHLLHAKPSKKTQDSLREAKGVPKEISESLKRIIETAKSYQREMLDGTKYMTIEELIDDIAKRYNGHVDAKDMPYECLNSWTGSHSRKDQRKGLLAYKQGHVCNRCHLIFSFDELTEDHIEGDRSRGQLRDLQLLCKNCNEEKGDGPTSESDVSPFNFEGETCVHRVKCTEIDTMLPFFDSETRDAICFCSPVN